MSNSELIQDQLRENNPFTSASSPMPFGNTTPDIEQIARSASEEIEHLIRQKRRNPSLPISGLVIGGAGTGKTHMLTRILRKIRKNSWSVIFVTVRAFTNPKKVMQELWSEIIVSMNKVHSDGRSQFDVVIQGMIDSYYEKRENDGFSNIESIDRKIYLKRDMPDINRTFLKCLILYSEADDEGTKYEITEWLREGLDDEDSERLGLPLRDIYSMEEAECESTAKNFITSLGIVLSYSHVPMIICFDEIDSIRDNTLITAWGDAVGFIMNHIEGILPLCFIKWETWDIFRHILNPSITQRLQNNTIKLDSNCSISQARRIIHDRIAAAFTDGVEEKYQWLISRMNDFLVPGLSPRIVIELANRTVRTDIKPEDCIQEIYDEDYIKIQSAPSAWPPNADYLLLALEVFLSSFENFSVSKRTYKYIKLVGAYGNKKLAFMVITAKGHTTVSAALKSGISFMKKYPGSECFYITEDQTHKKTWKQANENLHEFEAQGGHTVMLDKESRISWYALAALINRIDNGDVNLYTSSTPRTATRNDIKDFVRTLKLIDTKTIKNIEPSPPSITYSEEKETGKIETIDDALVKDTLKNIITASPMKIVTVDKAADILSQRGIKLVRNDVISIINNNSHLFKTFTSKNKDTLVTLSSEAAD